jgi:hypothetical protein
MVVTGAFATHTTRVWNYYVCPRNWDVDVQCVAVNYLSRLHFVGRVIHPVLLWTYDEQGRNIQGILTSSSLRVLVNSI